MTGKQKRCLHCSRKFPPKRSDQNFCLVNCRVYYNRNLKGKSSARLGVSNSSKTILSLCDYTGTWSRPYKEAGYNVIQVDIKHGQDVRLMKFPGDVHGVLAAPPCTHFASCGATSWEKKGKEALLEGFSIFDACSRIVLFSNPEFWVFENPVGRLKQYIGEPQWIFDPCDYGQDYTKKTCLWGHFNNPKPAPVVPVSAPPGHHSIDHYWRRQGKKLGKERQALTRIFRDH